MSFLHQHVSGEESPRTPTPRQGAASFWTEHDVRKESPRIPSLRTGAAPFQHKHDTGEESPRTPPPGAWIIPCGQRPYCVAYGALRTELPPSPLVEPATSEPLLRHCGSVAPAAARCIQVPLLHRQGGSSAAPCFVHGKPSTSTPCAAVAPPAPQPPLHLAQALQHAPPAPQHAPVLPLRRFIVVDGSATLSAWGVGAAVVGPSLCRELGDPMGRYDWCGGGRKEEFFAEQRRSGRKDDTSATAEAVAILAGVMLNAEFCQDQGLQKALPVITDKPSVLANLAGRGNAGPALEAACEKVALSLVDLVRHRGPVLFLSKHKIDAMRNTHGWLPDGLATRGRIRGGLGEPAGPRLPTDWRSWFEFHFEGELADPVSLTVSACALPVAGAFEFCNRLPRGGSEAASV